MNIDGLNVLVVYASAHGATAQIADFIGDKLHESGLHAHVMPANVAPPPDDFDAVVVGVAVHNRAMQQDVTEYLHAHHQMLLSRPCWLFSVGAGTTMHGPIGTPLKHLPNEFDHERVALRPFSWRRFAGVTERPRARTTGLVGRILGISYGDHRDWAAIGTWAESIASMVLARHSVMSGSW